MSYSVDFRKKVVEEITIHSQRKKDTSKKFRISRSTLYDWLSKYNENESLEKKKYERKNAKINDVELKQYVEKYPDFTLEEYGEYFNVHSTSIHKALKRLRISYKKKRQHIKSKIRKK